MSVLEPDAVSMPSAGGVDLPSFPIVMRGYDRQQVRAFVDQLRSYLADERRFSFLRSPRFVRDAAERHPRGLDLSVLHVEGSGNADERKRIARAIAHLQIMRAGRERKRRQIDRCD